MNHFLISNDARCLRRRFRFTLGILVLLFLFASFSRHVTQGLLVVLTPGESVPLDVTVTRHPRYTKPVNLAIVLQHLGGVHANPLPKGVTVKEADSKTLLGPDQTQGRIILQVASNAPACDRVPIAVMGHVSINFVVKTAYASAPIYVTVRPRRSDQTP